MSDHVKVFALGGLDEEGRDCYVVEINDDIFVLDCGMSLPDKTLPGIDALIPNFEYLIRNKSRIKAYIITHGHDEEIGALKFFYDFAPAPIYCTPMTKEFMESQAVLHKIKTSFKFQMVEPTSQHVIAGREVRFFQTCHNMAFSFGVAIWTDKGYVVYTSDFIVDFTVKYSAFKFDLKALAEISEKPTLLLMSESKCAALDGFCAPHHRTYNRLEKYFYEDKRIFLTCFWENVYRIREFFDLAETFHKKVYLYDEYTKNCIDFMTQKLDFTIKKDTIVSSSELLRVRSSDVVIFMLGHNEDIYTEIENIAMGRNEDKRIALNENDIFVIGAIPTDIYEVHATKCIDSLYRTNCEVVWLKRKDVPAMHARKDDLKFFLSVLRPKYYLPVRGIYTDLLDNAKLALSMGIGLNHSNVIVLDNGMQIEFGDTPRPILIPNEENKIAIAPILVDGTGISKVGDEVINDRIKLGVDGVVVIVSTVSRKEKRIIAGPDCQMRGFVYVKEAEPLLKAVSQTYVEEVTNALKEGVEDFEALQDDIKEKARKSIRKDNGREPLIIVSIIPID